MFKLILLYAIITLCLSYRIRYSHKTKYSAMTEAEITMRNFAMNLADTKELKISNIKKIKKFKKLNSIESDTPSGSIIINKEGKLTFIPQFLENDDSKKVIARARYTKSLSTIGWSRLYVETFDNTKPEILSWAAGFLEGKLTSVQMLDFYKNLIGIHMKEKEYLNDVFAYYKKVEEFIRYRTSKSELGSLEGKQLEYWISVAMIQAQTDGLLAGYLANQPNELLDLSQIYFINADGEVPELLTVFKNKHSSNNNYYSFKEEEKYGKKFLKKYFGSKDPQMVWDKLMSTSHCSAIIKILKDDNGKVIDLLIGHTTWDSYSEMHRIMKMYKFSYTLYGNMKKNSLVTFSSYPGTLTSTDDYYVINNRLVVLETTLEMLDRTVYEKNLPDANGHVPNYIRISVANKLATNGKEWTEIFKQNNSGTYNSQWMIIDLNQYENFKNISIEDEKKEINTSEKVLLNSINSFVNKANPINDGNIPSRVENPYIQTHEESLFKLFNSRIDTNTNNYILPGFESMPGFRFKSLNDEIGFFYILEQAPGFVEVSDMSEYLFNNAYWGSYNRPYLESISKISGYYDMMKRYGKTYSYFENPRAQIISNSIHNVKDIDSLKDLLQNNMNISKTDYINSLSPRYDLTINTEIKRSSGGIDTKIVNIDMIRHNKILAKSGPSTLNNAKPFNWKDWPNDPHYGLPEEWNFDWVYFEENFIKNNK